MTKPRRRIPAPPDERPDRDTATTDPRPADADTDLVTDIGPDRIPAALRLQLRRRPGR